jgi:fermentation-respiration switch protein FrsA (DUF1100 family)
MSEIPERIVLKDHLELRSVAFFRPARYALLVLLAIFIGFGLFNAFGQRPQTLWLHTPQATVELYAPNHVRGGLFFEARFTITAHEDIRNALLQLSPGWDEGMQMNTVEPNPLGYGSRDGDLLFTLGHIPKGHVYRLFLEFQVNATNVGRRRADATLYDGGTKIGTIQRTVTVYP